MGIVNGPFFPNRSRISQSLISVLHFGENFMKTAPKITKLQLITFGFVVGFDEYF